MSYAKEQAAKRDASRRRRTSRGNPPHELRHAQEDAPCRSADEIVLRSFAELMKEFASRDDGWLRLIPDGESKIVFLKWKFTRGKFAGFYAFVSGPYYDVIHLLCTLEEQIANIYLGAARPTRDKPYSSD